MHYWTPADREWLRHLDTLLAEGGHSLDALAGDAAEDVRDLILEAAGRYQGIRLTHSTEVDHPACPDDCPSCTGLVPAGTNLYAELVPDDVSGTDPGTASETVGTTAGTTVGTTAGTTVGTSTAPPVPDEVGTGTSVGTTPGTGTAPLVPAPRQPGTTPGTSGTGTGDELADLGTKLYRDSIAAGTGMSERDLAEALGQKGRRLARRIIASVRAEMAQGGAQHV